MDPEQRRIPRDPHWRSDGASQPSRRTSGWAPGAAAPAGRPAGGPPARATRPGPADGILVNPAGVRKDRVRSQYIQGTAGRATATIREWLMVL